MNTLYVAEQIHACALTDSDYAYIVGGTIGAWLIIFVAVFCVTLFNERRTNRRHRIWAEGNVADTVVPRAAAEAQVWCRGQN
jgi:hypothetical protein